MSSVYSRFVLVRGKQLLSNYLYSVFSPCKQWLKSTLMTGQCQPRVSRVRVAALAQREPSRYTVYCTA